LPICRTARLPPRGAGCRPITGKPNPAYLLASVSSKRRPASRSLVAALFSFQGPTRANSPETRFVRPAVTVARGELSRRHPHYFITSPSLLQGGFCPAAGLFPGPGGHYPI